MIIVKLKTLTINYYNKDKINTNSLLYLAVGDDTAEFIDGSSAKVYLFTDHSVPFVVRIVGVSELTVGSDLEF